MTSRNKVRPAVWTVLLMVGGCAQVARPGLPPEAASPGLPPEVQQAAANYPPMILGANVHATDGHEIPRSCAPAGARVEQKGGPTFAFGGADPSDPELCVMTVAGQTSRGWYDIWLTDWPGADDGHKALHTVIHGPSGTVAGFDTRMAPGLQWHDLVRNEGVEDISLLGGTYHALKISHYREGFDGNDYRSVSTIWKDIPTGMLIYGTYHHISGRPEIDDPLIPTAIVLPPASPSP